MQKTYPVKFMTASRLPEYEDTNNNCPSYVVIETFESFCK